jgi:hypothetical protein
MYVGLALAGVGINHGVTSQSQHRHGYLILLSMLLVYLGVFNALANLDLTKPLLTGVLLRWARYLSS